MGTETEENRHLASMSRDDFESLMDGYLVFIEFLNERDVRYCLVGGLAVMLHAYEAGYSQMRKTTDVDVMFDDSYTNGQFARAYLAVYGIDPKVGSAIYECLFGAGSFSELEDPAQALLNTSFLGLEVGDGEVRTPSFDVVRKLNGFDLGTLDSEVIEINGIPIQVATVNQLIEMKERTISLLTSIPGSKLRPQDVIDLEALRGMSAEEHGIMDREVSHEDVR